MDDGIKGWLGLDYGVESLRGGNVRHNAKVKGCASFWEVFEDLISFRLRTHDSPDRVGGFKEQ